MYDRILAAVDGSPTAERALDEAVQLAQKFGSELVITHMINNSYLMYDVDYVDVGTFTEALVKQSNQIVTDARAKAEKAGVYIHSVVVDDPIGTFDIGTTTEQVAHNVGARVLVLGTHGRRDSQRLFLGGVIESIARRSILPALLVRAGPTETSYAPTEPLSNAAIA